MKFFFSFFLLFTCLHTLSQTYKVRGSVADEKNIPVKNAQISIEGRQTKKTGTGSDGVFELSVTQPGAYLMTIGAAGKETYYDSIKIKDTLTTAGRVELREAIHQLDEVKITEKLLAVIQKDDTMEYNSGAYKVNPDADADELIKKMPAMQMNGRQIKAQGETVVQVLVDGKPFFGTDPYTSLKNLPADIIAKVQVYNEKSDQEQFTGFSEVPTKKTINIITKPDKRNGVFGKVYGGGGGDVPAGARDVNANKYGTGGSMSSFAGQRRATVTAQSNNINEQNFADQANVNGAVPGIIKTNAGGINLSDKWGQKTEMTASYFFSNTNSSREQQLRKTYILPADSGQVYDERNAANNNAYRHSMSLRLHYETDTMNSLLLQAQGNINSTITSTTRQAATTAGLADINSTAANNTANTKGNDLSGSLLYRHRFHKKGRTLSMTASAGNNGSNGIAFNNSENIYYFSSLPDDTLRQKSIQGHITQSLGGNMVYTEPAGNHGIIKAEYNVSYQQNDADKTTNDYSLVTGNYSDRNNLYSNSFGSTQALHKAGGSYLFHNSRYEASGGIYYQLSALGNEQRHPDSYSLSQSFHSILPVATFKYKFSKARYLQCTYNSATQPPALTQLQRVVNNTDPLHLYTGNAGLKQSYQHGITLYYNTSSTDALHSFAVSLTGRYTQHSITTSSLIADNDTLVTTQRILLRRGSQLTMPVNIEGAAGVSSSISYLMPLTFIKSAIDISLTGGVGQTPGIINERINYSRNNNIGLGLSLNSNISEKIDFIVTSNGSVVNTANSLNTQLNTTYINATNNAALNLILWKGIVFNTSITYVVNAGLSAGYDKNYLLANMSIGKKIFYKQRGDIRLTVFDLLNNNNSIQQVVTDNYIQNAQSSIIQRYYMLVFSYKFRNF